jgi:HEPN domain-containing protein
MPTNFNEVDKFLTKADDISNEAKNHNASRKFDLCVRRAQEAFELYLKTAFRYIGREYSKSHDIKQEIYDLCSSLDKYHSESKAVAQIVLRHQVLNMWREPSFYGDEKLGISEIFTEKESELALFYVEEISWFCRTIRAHEYGKQVSNPKSVSTKSQ